MGLTVAGMRYGRGRGAGCELFHLPHRYAFPNLVLSIFNGVPCYVVYSRVTTESWDRATYERKRREHLANLSSHQGISAATAIPKYLLIAFNVFLDLLMGCSSGGAAVHNTDPLVPSSAKMVHFRTLDWDMSSLRRVIVILDFVLEPGGEVVASSITYAGFVGVLTGVRRGVSLSLNFRAVREDSGSWMGDLRYWSHLGLVLLGFRRWISSILRGCLLPRGEGGGGSAPAVDVSLSTSDLPSCAEIVEDFSCRGKPLLSTVCYLCFCSGRETTIIEKDLATAKLRSSTVFIVVTNADHVAIEPDEAGAAGPKTKATSKPAGRKAKTTQQPQSPPATALEEIIEESNERKVCAERNYRNLLRRQSEPLRRDPNYSAPLILPSVEDIVELVQKYPTTNECTHFAAVLDALEGKVAWCRCWLEPIDEV
jgi:hypothetical protein